MIAFCAFQVRWPGHRRVHVDRPFLPFRVPVAVSTFFLPVFFTFSFLPSCSSAPLLLRCRLQQKKVPSSPPIHSTMQWSEREIPPLVVWWRTDNRPLFSSSHSLVEVGSTQTSKTQRTTRNPRAEQPSSLDASGTLILFSLSHLNTTSDLLALVAFPTQQQQQTCCSVHRR